MVSNTVGTGIVNPTTQLNVITVEANVCMVNQLEKFRYEKMGRPVNMNMLGLPMVGAILSIAANIVKTLTILIQEIEMYYKRVPMTLTEAVMSESLKGFDSKDEFYEVMREIADLYDVTLAEVLGIFYNQNELEMM